MVSQNLVEQVMEKLNRPCTARDIANYIREHELIINVPSDIAFDVSTVLNALRKWEVTDKFPDLHGTDSNKWYLRLNYTHDSKNCEYCKGIKTAHTHNTYKHMISSRSRNIRLVGDREHMIPNELGIDVRDWDY